MSDLSGKELKQAAITAGAAASAAVASENIAGRRGDDISSRDIFHRGRFYLTQPRKCGHRSGIDAMILAACLPRGFSGYGADFGAGSGAAALAALSRCAGARMALVENSDLMLDYARRTLADPANAALAGRAELIAADISLKGRARIEAGLKDNMFDFVLMNPPFNDRSDRPTPDREKAKAHIMREGMLEEWLRAAAAVVKPQGGLALIVRPYLLAEVFAACRGRFGALQLVPVYPRADAAAIRLAVRGIRGSRGLPRFMPPLILHGEGGHNFLPRADDVNNGRRGLFEEDEAEAI